MKCIGHTLKPYSPVKPTKYRPDLNLMDLIYDSANPYGLADCGNRKLVPEVFARFDHLVPEVLTGLIEAHFHDLVTIQRILMAPYWGRGSRRLTITETIGAQDIIKSSTSFYLDKKGNVINDNMAWCVDLLSHPGMVFNYAPLWVNALKDEVRRKDKLPRGFQFLTFPHNLVYTSYVKHQNIMISEDWEAGYMALGISLPNDWYRFIDRLLRNRGSEPGFTTLYVEADVKTFDASQCILLFIVNSIVRLTFMRGLAVDEIQEYLELVFHHMYRIHIDADGKVYLASSGNPSGAGDTTVTNGMSYISMLMLLWVHSGRNVKSFVSFMERSGLTVFGDDLAAALHTQDDVVFFRFCDENWEKVFGKTITIKFTSNIAELTFLGNHSQTCEGDGLYTPVISDHQRALANAALKGPKDHDFIIMCQRYAAHRRLMVYHDDCLNDPYKLLMCVIERSLPRLYELVKADKSYTQLYLSLSSDDETFKMLYMPDYSSRTTDLSEIRQSAVSVCKPWFKRFPSGPDCYRVKTHSMLSYGEFIQKHATKYAGLSNAEKRSRYNDYKSTFAASTSSSGGNSSAAGAKRASTPKAGVKRPKEYYGSVQSGGISGYMGSGSSPTGQSNAINRSSAVLANHPLGNLSMDKNSQGFLAGLGDPFKRTNGKESSAPVGSDGYVHPLQIFVDFEIEAGPDGTAAAMFSPLAAASGDTGCVVATLSNYNGGKQFPQNGDAGYNDDLVSNSPYNAGDAHSGDFAVVINNAGLCVSYTGPVVDRSGVAYETLITGVNLDGVSTTQIAQELYRTSQIKSVTDNWEKYSVIWTPTIIATAAKESSFGDNFGIMQSNSSFRPTQLQDVDSYAQNNMGVLITGAKPGTSFYCRAICTITFFGGTDMLDGDTVDKDFVRYAKPAKNDPSIISMVSNAAESVSLNATPKKTDGSIGTTNWADFLAKGAEGVTALNSIMNVGSKLMGSTSSSVDSSWLDGMEARMLDLQMPSVPSGIGDVVEPLMEEAPEIFEVAPLLLA